MIGIYKITINGKNYVGSSINIKQRLRQHKTDLKCNRHDNPYLQSAYNKYKEFDWEIIEELFTSVGLTTRELYYIQKLNAEYNIQHPVTNFNVKPVYQFALNGEFICKHESTADAARELGISQSNIVHAAQINEQFTKTAGGYRWSYTENITFEDDKRWAPLYIYNIEGKFITKYKNYIECNKDLFPDEPYDRMMRGIQFVLRNVICSWRGYRYAKEYISQLDNSKLLSITKNFPVVQISKDGKYKLKVWPSASVANKELGGYSSCGITEAINKNKICLGFRWTRLGTKLSELLEYPEDDNTTT